MGPASEDSARFHQQLAEPTGAEPTVWGPTAILIRRYVNTFSRLPLPSANKSHGTLFSTYLFSRIFKYILIEKYMILLILLVLL